MRARISPRRWLNRLERAYRGLPTFRTWVVGAAALFALGLGMVADYVTNRQTQKPETAFFNTITTYMRGRAEEPFEANYYKAQVHLFTRQFFESDPDIPRYDLYIDPSELHRLSATFDDTRDQQPLRDSWRVWYPLGDRKTGLAFLKSGDQLHPVHMRIRGEGSNHYLGPLKSWRITRIALPGAPRWRLPTDSLNLSLPELHLLERTGIEIARQAGMHTPFYEIGVLYINGVFQGIREVSGQSGAPHMHANGLPIGFVIDPRNDRWVSWENQPPPEVMYDYRFGSRPQGGDFRNFDYDIPREQLVSLYTFYLLYRTEHTIDMRWYLHPVTNQVLFIPWNLERPEALLSRFEKAPALSRAALDISKSNFEELASVDYLFGHVVYRRLTPDMIHEIFSRIYRLTREGQPLNAEKLKADYLALEARFKDELDALPYLYGSRNYNFYRDAYRVAAYWRDGTLFPGIDLANRFALADAERLDLACTFSPNADGGHGVLGRLRCRSGGAVGALITAIGTGGAGGAAPAIVYDVNGNGRVDAADKRLARQPAAESAEGLIGLGPVGFQVLYDGRELAPAYEESRLNLYDFLLVGDDAAAVPSAVHVRQPLTGAEATIAVEAAEPGRFAREVAAEALPAWTEADQETALRPATPEPEPDLPPFVRRLDAGSYAISAGRHAIDRPLVLPDGARLAIEPGATLALAPGAYLYATGPVIAEGTADRPIVFTSDGGRAGGNVIVNYTRGEPSRFKHCRFERGGESLVNGVGYAGALNLLGAEAVIESCAFTDVQAEAGVSVRWGSVEMAGGSFERTKADALRLETSVGTVRDTRFADIGQDGIDLDDGNMLIEGIRVEDAAASGVLAGTRSFVTIRGGRFERAGVGVMIADDAHVDLLNSTVAASRVAVHVHRRIENRNSMTVTLDNLDTHDNGTDVLKDPGTPERAVRRVGQAF